MGYASEKPTRIIILGGGQFAGCDVTPCHTESHADGHGTRPCVSKGADRERAGGNVCMYNMTRVYI